MKQRQFLAVALTCSVFLVSIGCSNPDSKYAKVTGTITYKQQPVEGANVTFLPVDSGGEPASGRTDASGTFSLTSSQAVGGGRGVLPGEYLVIVSKRLPPKDPDDPNEPAVELFPAKYSDPGTTDLRVTITRGSTNTPSFDLTD